jgi:DNA-binding CsgD family transcriptional regulator
MLERDEELAGLDSLIEGARAGAGRLAIVEGPAGIGKTELLRAAAEHARQRDLAVLTASGDHLERDFPFGVARALFEPLLAGAVPERRAELLSGAARQAAPALGLDHHGEPPRGAGETSFPALHGLYWLSSNLAAEGPLLIVVDDAQWTDAASLRWLAYLGRRVEELPVLLALGVRPGQGGHASELLAAISALPPARVIRPAPLSEDATGRLIGEALGAEADREFARSCQSATGGNPFLVRQLASALAADGVSPLASEADRVGQLGPGTVARALVLRLAHLPPAAGALAQAIAVLGAGVDRRLAAALAGSDLPAAAEAADALAGVEIIEDARRLSFVHPIVQAAIYEDMRSGRRAQLHGQAAGLLAGEGAEPARVATHLLATEPAADRWVTKTLRAAARDARGRGDPDTAVAYLRRALAEPVDPESRTDVLVELGLAEELTSAPGAVEHLRQAYEALADPVERGRIASMLARALLNTGSPEAGAEIAREAATGLPPEQEDMRRALEAFELIAVFFGSGAPEALRRLDEQRTPREDDGTGAKMLAAVAALVWAYSARPADACAELALAARAGEEPIAADNPVLSIVAIIPLALADRDEALDAWRVSLADAHRRGSLYSVSAIHLWHGFTLYRRGELTEAEASLRSGLDEAILYGYGPGVIVYFSAFLAATLLARGDTSGARQALERGDHTGAGPDGARWWLVSRAELLLAEGRADEALPAAEEVEAASGWIVNPAAAPWRSLKAQALDRLGRDGGVALAQEELALARRFGAPGTVGRALRVLGALERREGLDHLREAVETLRGSPAPLEHAEALAALGASLRRSGERKAAREPLREAVELAQRCGAGALADRAREELVATGARPRRAYLSGPDSLTASERRIARMAITGMTNRDIAQALFVTVRTVETHLSHVYRKLDLHSRAELGAALGQEDGSVGDEGAPPPTSAAPRKDT